MITPELVEEVRRAADIVEVVSDYTRLKKSGRYWVGLSPFKVEKTPSFTVTPERNIFKCFSTGKGGDIFNFLMEVDGVSFTEAVKTLAERYGVPIPENDSPEYMANMKRKEGVFHALKFAGAMFHRNLMESDEASKALDYLKTRGLSVPTIKKYGLGYSMDSYSSLIKQASSAGINEEYLVEAGLIRQGQQGKPPYDYFRARLMFPIFNPTQKVIGFGGRILDDKQSAKYINSPQTVVYNKSEVLYGIHVAKNAIRQKDQTILVEGYMDVLQLHQAGIDNVVSSSGTALTPDQARILKRYSDNLLMIYDADTAGQNAMIKALNVTLSEGLNVRLLHLPDGDDPDSYVQKHGHFSFEEYVKKNATDFLNFLVQKAEREGAWDDPIRSGEYVKLILEQISSVSDPIVRETMVQHLSQLTRIGDRTLFAQLGKLTGAKRNESAPPPKMPRNVERPPDESTNSVFNQELVHPDMRPYEKEVLRLMIQYGRPMVDYVGKLINAEHFTHPLLVRLFNEIIERFRDEKRFDMETLTRLPDPYPSLMSELFIERESPSEKLATRSGRVLSRDLDPYASVKGALKALKIHYLERLSDQIEAYLHKIEDTDSEEYRQARHKEIEIKKVRHAFLSKPDAALFPPSPKPDNDELFGA